MDMNYRDNMMYLLQRFITFSCITPAEIGNHLLPKPQSSRNTAHIQAVICRFINHSQFAMKTS
jgi:hypothetical protein